MSHVNAHAWVLSDFGPHGHLPGIKIPYVCIEAATVLEMRYIGTCLGVGACPGHYGIILMICCVYLLHYSGIPLNGHP